MALPPEEIILTDNQIEACDLICQGLSDGEISVKLNISRSAVLNRFKAALKKLGVKEMERRYHHITIREKVQWQLKHNTERTNIKPIEELREMNTVEVKIRRESQEVARKNTLIAQKKALELEMPDGGDPTEALQKLMAVAKKAGVSPGLIEGLGNRIIRGSVDVESIPARYKDEDLKAELHKKVRMVLAHIDPASIGGAKLTELSTMLKTLQEQVQLIEGKPTAILSIEDKTSLGTVSALLQAELKRRGEVIDGSCKEVPNEVPEEDS